MIDSRWKKSLLPVFGIKTLPHIPNTLPMTMVIGTALSFYGMRFRHQAYRAMGNQFTFELSLKEDHKLIQSYPYNIVRHPSYTGIFVSWTGMALVLSPKEGWIRSVLWPTMMSSNAGLGKTFMIGGVITIAACYGMLVIATFVRVSKEDKLLQARFGRNWEEWAERVPYRLIPGIF
jgi:protein-S-isoprenylcysteine O-methyltransferase Ste14